MGKFSRFVAIVIAIVTLFSISAFAATEGGEWIVDGDTCYWSEAGVKSRAHKHTEEALADYVTGYDKNYNAIVSSCPICNMQNFTITHVHDLTTQGPSYFNLKTYWQKGNYVYDDSYHWYTTFCSDCDYQTYKKEAHEWNVVTKYDAATNKDLTIKTCKVCGHVVETTSSHKHNFVCTRRFKVSLGPSGHDKYGEETCTGCGKTQILKYDSNVGHFMWDDKTWYEDGHIWKHWYCHEGCGYEYNKIEGDCDHNPEYVTFTYKAIEGSTLIEKVCDCCGKTIEYVENNVSSTEGAIENEYAEYNTAGGESNSVVELIKVGKKVNAIGYVNNNEMLEGEFTADKLCYVAPYSAANGVSEKTVFTGVKFWSIDKNGTVTYELITSEGLVGFAHAEDVNW